jgi:hypothetical protein
MGPDQLRIANNKRFPEVAACAFAASRYVFLQGIGVSPGRDVHEAAQATSANHA